ncbi:MAG TPA: pseudouridine synthase [Cytophagaceae bacterium]|nr:pseudouridine synthase [Cytophagaceae bacterium]
MTINEFLIKTIPTSGKESILLIQQKRVFINHEQALQHQSISERDEIIFDGQVIQKPYAYFYLAYYKPRGIECTMSTNIPDNLADALSEVENFFPVGRLDKDSEGLMILTNDGQLYKNIAPSESIKEKEYIVTVDHALTEEDIRQLATGVVIMGKRTRPAQVFRESDFSFRIILTQGLNRQIRRMCYKLGYEVTELKRIRIHALRLDALEPGQYRAIEREDILGV